MIFAASAQSPYFTAKELADGVKYLPAPPDTTSIQYASDMNTFFQTKTLRDTERGAEAINHANGVYIHICSIFSPVFGLTITPSGTPAIYTMLSNSLKTCSKSKMLTSISYALKDN